MTTDTTHITKEGLLQAVKELGTGPALYEPGVMDWILARAAELSAQDAPASAVVPSHEAVEKWCINPHTGHPFEAANMLRTLLAEVERLTAENKSLCWYGSNEERAQLRTTVAQLERTVADQAAALAERDKDAFVFNHDQGISRAD